MALGVALACGVAGCSLGGSASSAQKAEDACTAQLDATYGATVIVSYTKTTPGDDGSFSFTGSAQGGTTPGNRIGFTCSADLAGDTYVATISTN